MITAKQVINSIKPKITKVPTGGTQLGSAGYDNVREDIEKIKNLREGTINRTPTNDIDIANKKYVDDNAGGTGSMTTVKEDGVQLGGADIVTLDFLGADFNLTETPDTEVNIVINDAGIDHDATTNFVANEHLDWTASVGTIHTDNYIENVTTDLSAGTRAPTTIDVNSSDGTNATLVEADTTNAGILGSDKWDEIVANTAKNTNVTTNITVVEAPTNVDIQSSDGSNDTIAAADVTNAGVMTTTMYDEHVVNTAHALDNTQAHTDYLLNSATDVGVGLTLTGDNSSADTAYVPMVLYNTDATPPAASGFPIGTLYVQYTA